MHDCGAEKFIFRIGENADALFQVSLMHPASSCSSVKPGGREKEQDDGGERRETKDCVLKR